MNIRGKGLLILINILLAILVLAAAGIAVFFYIRYQGSNLRENNQELQQIVEIISKAFKLPDEEPTLATVTDREKLAEQGFFTNAENGDKVLIFRQAQKALLYRPSIKKIIDVVTVKITQDQKSTASGSAKKSSANLAQTQSNDKNAQEKVRVVLYNGTQQPGITQKLEDKITTEDLQIDIADKDNASKDNYAKTIVVDISGQYPEMAEELAILFSTSVEPLPAEETPPNADILIIAGGEFL